MFDIKKLLKIAETDPNLAIEKFMIHDGENIDTYSYNKAFNPADKYIKILQKDQPYELKHNNKGMYDCNQRDIDKMTAMMDTEPTKAKHVYIYDGFNGIEVPNTDLAQTYIKNSVENAKESL